MLTTVKATLSADWSAAGTITVSYPAGIEAGHIAPIDHKISVKNGADLKQGRDFALTTVNKATAVFTLAAGLATIPAGSEIFVEFALKGDRAYVDPNNIAAAKGYAALGNRVSNRQPIEINFGAPSAAAAASVAAVQLVGAAGNLTLNGSLVSSGVATLDVPRNATLTVATTNHSARTFTIYGTDEYGVAMVENIAGPNNNTVAGLKAFKKITRVAVDGAIATNGVSVGHGDVLGFPIFVPNAVNILYDTENDATVTDGTYVAGVVTKPTATTGDVRGTYDPNSACDGAKRFSVMMLVENPNYLGVPQFAG